MVVKGVIIISRLFDGFSFSVYFSNYLKKKGITKKKISELLQVNYSTLRNKFSNDSFTYQEIHFLDSFYSDLRYWENRNNYLTIRFKEANVTIHEFDGQFMLRSLS